MTDREFVEQHWKRVRVSNRYANRNCAGVPIESWTIRISGEWTSTVGDTADAPEMWSAAAAFTRQRLEQIAEVEEEIEVLKDLRVPLQKIAPFMRLGREAEKRLADLKRGMK